MPHASHSLKIVRDKLMFIVIGARDFSPEITVHLIGTKVPCFDKVPPPQIPIYPSLAAYQKRHSVSGVPLFFFL